MLYLVKNTGTQQASNCYTCIITVISNVMPKEMHHYHNVLPCSCLCHIVRDSYTFNDYSLCFPTGFAFKRTDSFWSWIEDTIVLHLIITESYSLSKKLICRTERESLFFLPPPHFCHPSRGKVLIIIVWIKRGSGSDSCIFVHLFPRASITIYHKLNVLELYCVTLLQARRPKCCEGNVSSKGKFCSRFLSYILIVSSLVRT